MIDIWEDFNSPAAHRKYQLLYIGKEQLSAEDREWLDKYLLHEKLEWEAQQSQDDYDEEDTDE